MNSIPLVASLVCLIFDLGKVHGEQQCYGVNSGVDYSPGSNDMLQRGGLNLGGCCDLCKSTVGCKAFVWSKFWKTCWLKSANGPQKQNADRISGFPDNSMETNSNAQCSLVKSGLDYSPGSHDIASLANTDLTGCCSYCNSNPSCKAYVWSKSSQKCWLKDVDYPRVGSGDRISGVRGSSIPMPPTPAPVTPAPVTQAPVTPAPNECGTTADYDNSSPNLLCYDFCPQGDAAACQCCKDKGGRGGKCFNGVPYCFK